MVKLADGSGVYAYDQKFVRKADLPAASSPEPAEKKAPSRDAATGLSCPARPSVCEDQGRAQARAKAALALVAPLSAKALKPRMSVRPRAKAAASENAVGKKVDVTPKGGAMKATGWEDQVGPDSKR